MNADFEKIIQESIKIELQVADLYLFFYGNFPEDAGFWWQIAIEEKNHAALIKSLELISEHVNDLPEEIFSSSLEDLIATNKMLTSVIEDCKVAPPDRNTAFNTALTIEESAGELHYQGFMGDGKDSHLHINKVFRQLNREDKDHSLRLRAYMAANSITIS